jgi:hypothetical protein
LPIEITEKQDDQKFDSFLIIGNDLEANLEKCKLHDYLDELKHVKKVGNKRSSRGNSCLRSFTISLKRSEVF